MCDDEYNGETSRTLRERYKEHLKEPSPIFEHCNISVCSTNPDNFTNIGREDCGLARTIKESIYIRVNYPTLNRNLSKYNFTIYGTESSLAPHNLELMSMCTEHPSVGLHSASHLIGMCIEQLHILGMFREHHLLSMCIVYHRTHIRQWNSLLPQTWWCPVAVWMKACPKNNWSSVKKTNLHLNTCTYTIQAHHNHEDIHKLHLIDWSPSL